MFWLPSATQSIVDEWVRVSKLSVHVIQMPWVWCVQHLLQLLLTFAWQVASQRVCSPCRCRRCCWSCAWRNWRTWPVTASTAGPPPTLSSRSLPTPTPTTPPYQGTSRSQVGGCLLIASAACLWLMVGPLWEKTPPPFFLTLSSLKTATAVERIFPFIPENL